MRQISNKTLAFKSLILFLTIVALAMIGGCVQKGNHDTVSQNAVAKDNDSAPPPIPVEIPNRPHLDSIKKWNAELAYDITNSTLKPDADTKYFTMDAATGEVIGCPMLQCIGLQNWKKDSLQQASNQAKFNKLLPKLEKAWLGTKEIIKSEEFPEGEESYPNIGCFSKDDEYIVVPDGHSHGGTVDRVYFFNKKGKLLKVYKLGFHLEVPDFRFNDEKTFFILSSSVSPFFYYFYPDGRLYKSGNFKELTGNKGNSYGNNNISTNGDYFILRNNISYLYDRGSNLIAKFKIGGNTLFSGNFLFFSYGPNVTIYNLATKKIEYQSTINNNSEIGIFLNKRFYLKINTNRYEYNIINN